MTEPKQDLAPLDHDAAALRDALRSTDPMPSDARERVMKKLATRIAVAGAVAAAAHSAQTMSATAEASSTVGNATRVTVALSKASLAALIAGAIGLGAAVGGVMGHSIATHTQAPPREVRVEVEKVVYRDRIVEVDRASATQAAAQTTPIILPRAQDHGQHNAAQPSVAQPTPAVVLPATQSASDEAREQERRIITRVHAALTRQHHQDALDAIDEHARTFPDGWLSEEREALRVQALAGLSRTEEARTRAAEFITAHPTSLFRGLVERAVDSPR